VGGCVDSVAAQAVAQMRFDKAFIGACAVSADGVAAFHHADASLKRVVIAQTDQVVVLATTDKLEERAPHHVAALVRIDLLVIGKGTSPAQRSALEAGGCIRLMIAEAA
jgi:DeoR/GlpR family transcriptional regulator of sugar metabolism